MIKGNSFTGTAGWWLAMLLWAAAGGPATAAPKGKVIPAEPECKALGQAVAMVLNLKDGDAFIKAFDADALMDRALEGNPFADSLKPADRNTMRDQFMNGLKGASARGGEHEYIRYQAGDEARVLLRIIRDTGDFDYVSLTLAQIRGQLRVVDMNIFSAGEYASAAMGRALLPLLAEQNKSFLQKVSGEQSDFIKHLQECVTYVTLNREGKFAEALAVYAKLPTSLQNGKSYQVLRLSAVMSATPKEYPAALEHFRKLFPGDPAIAYYTYYAHLAGRQYAEMLVDVDAMDKELGPDRFFHLLRARVYSLMKDGAAALRSARSGLASPRKFDAMGRYCLTLTMKAQRHEDAAKLLSEFERDTGLEMYAMIRKNPVCADFLRTPEFKTWMASPTKLAVDPAIKPAAETAAAPARPAARAGDAPKATTDAPKAPEPAYKLGGILFSKTSPAAIINGKTLYVGDKIKEAKVVKIEQSSVTLEINGKVEELKLK